MTANEVNVSDETLNTIIQSLDKLGFSWDEDEREQFVRSVRNPELYYFGGTFEWSERAVGLRVYISRDYYNNSIREVRVHSNGSYVSHTQETIDAVNKELSAIFTD